MTILRILDDSGIECPKFLHGSPEPLHVLATRAYDIIWEAMEKNEDGEIKKESDNAILMAMSNKLSSRMECFRQSTTVWTGQRHTIHTYFYKCLICGFILPMGSNV